jgi:hypothetical protein
MEPGDRGEEIRRHLGELLPSTAGAVGGALVAVAVAGPTGALTGAASGAVLDHVVKEALGRRRKRGTRALDIAAAEAHLTPEQLLQRILADERLLELAATVIAAAAETTLNAKIRALGQALARGTLATDEAEIDVERFMVATLAALEAPHIRVLHQMVRRHEDYGEEWGPDGRHKAHGWTLEALNKQLPGLSTVHRPVLGTLSANGLIWDTAIGAPGYDVETLGHPSRWAVSLYGARVLRAVEASGAEES